MFYVKPTISLASSWIIIRKNTLIYLKDFTQNICSSSLILDRILSSFSINIVLRVVFLNELPYQSKPPKISFSKYWFQFSCFCVKLHILPSTSDNTSIAQEPRICRHISNQICAIFLQYFSSKNTEETLDAHINPTSWRFHSHSQAVVWWDLTTIRI